MDKRLLEQILLMLAVFLAAMFLGRLVRRLMLGDRLVDAAEVRRRLDAKEDMLVVDVRTPAEFAGDLGHIRGAVNLPLHQLSGRLAAVRDQLAAYRRTPVLVVCRTDNRAATAYRLLRRAGLENVLVLKGGMTRWNAEKLPVVRGAS